MIKYNNVWATIFYPIIIDDFFLFVNVTRSKNRKFMANVIISMCVCIGNGKTEILAV